MAERHQPHQQRPAETCHQPHRDQQGIIRRGEDATQMDLVERTGTGCQKLRGKKCHHRRDNHRAERGQHQRAKQNLSNEQASG